MEEEGKMCDQKHSAWRFSMLVVLMMGMAILTAACGGQPPPTPQPPQPTTAPEATKAPAATTAAVVTNAPQPTSAPAATKAPEATKAPLSPVEEALAGVKGLNAADREKKLLESAKKEGAFMLYSSMNATDAQPIIDAFNQKYPGVNARFFRASSGDLYTKLVTEARGGQILWDVMDIAPEYVASLEDEGLLTAYDSPVRNELPEALRDSKGIWTSLYLNDNVITWNTKLVKPEDAPKTYEDLLDPKWKGKISLDTEDYPWAYYIFQTMGKEKGADFLSKLAAQKPQMIKGRTNQTNMLIAGEVSVSVALYDYMEIQQQQKGAPVAFGYVEPVRLENEPLMLAKKAAHPNAALLFLDWMIGKEGQTTMVKITNRIPVRTDVATLSERQAAVLKGKYTLIPPEELGKNLKDMQQQFDKIFGVTR
jgi:iron(III) transport system substrate-binding protein